MKKLKITRIDNEDYFTVFDFIKNEDVYEILNSIVNKFNFHQGNLIENDGFDNPIDEQQYFKNNTGDIEFHVVYGLNKLFFILLKTTPEFKEYLLEHSEFLKP